MKVPANQIIWSSRLVTILAIKGLVCDMHDFIRQICTRLLPGALYWHLILGRAQIPTKTIIRRGEM